MFNKNQQTKSVKTNRAKPSRFFREENTSGLNLVSERWVQNNPIKFDFKPTDYQEFKNKYNHISSTELKRSVMSGADFRIEGEPDSELVLALQQNKDKLKKKSSQTETTNNIQNQEQPVEFFVSDNTSESEFSLDNSEPLLGTMIAAHELGIIEKEVGITEKLSDHGEDIALIADNILSLYADVHHLPAPSVKYNVDDKKFIIEISRRAKEDLHTVRKLSKAYYLRAIENADIEDTLTKYGLDENGEWYTIKDDLKWLVDPKSQNYSLTTPSALEGNFPDLLPINDGTDLGIDMIDNELQRKIVEINKELLQVKSDNANLRHALSEFRIKLDKSNSRIQELLKQLDKSEQEVKKLKEEIAKNKQTTSEVDKSSDNPDQNDQNAKKDNIPCSITVPHKKSGEVLVLAIPESYKSQVTDNNAPNMARTILESTKRYHRAKVLFDIAKSKYNK